MLLYVSLVAAQIFILIDSLFRLEFWHLTQYALIASIVILFVLYISAIVRNVGASGRFIGTVDDPYFAIACLLAASNVFIAKTEIDKDIQRVDLERPKTWVAFDAPKSMEQGQPHVLRAIINRRVTEQKILEAVVSQREKAAVTDERDLPEAQVIDAKPMIFASLSATGLTFDPKDVEARSFKSNIKEISWNWTIRLDPSEAIPSEGRNYIVLLNIQGAVGRSGQKTHLATIPKIIHVYIGSEGLFNKFIGWLSTGWPIILAAFGAIGILVRWFFKKLKKDRSTLVDDAIKLRDNQK